MDLAGARVLLVSDDPETLERVHGYLSRAGAIPDATTRTAGIVAAARNCDVAVLFDDCGEPDEFEARLSLLTRAGASLLLVTDRASLRDKVPDAGMLFAPTRLVWGWALLDAIRARVRPSTPELPFTD